MYVYFSGNLAIASYQVTISVQQILKMDQTDLAVQDSSCHHLGLPTNS
jgi:hypothetical protein